MAAIRRMIPERKPKPKKMTLRPRDEREPDRDMRQRVDAILDKINEVGYDKLTDEERRILMDASQNLSRKDH
jgi:predicted DNA binding protein